MDISVVAAKIVGTGKVKNKFVPEISTNAVYWFYALLLIAMPINFSLRLLYTHTLAPSDVGLLYGMISFFAVISLFVNFGFSASLRYFIPTYIVKKQFQKACNLFWYSYGLQACAVALATIILVPLSSFFLTFYFKAPGMHVVFYGFLIFFIANNLIYTLLDVFLSLGKTISYQIIYLFQMLSILVGSFLLWHFDNPQLVSVYSLAWGLCTLGVFIFYLLRLMKLAPFIFKKPRFEFPLFKAYLSYAAAMFSSNIAMNFLTKIDAVMITGILTLTQLAYYSNAIAITDAITSIVSAFTIVMMPMLTSLYAQNKVEQLEKLIRFLYVTMLYLTVPLTLVSVLFAKSLLTHLYGTQYVAGLGVLVLFGATIFLRLINQYNLTFINSVGLGNKQYKVIFTAVFVNIILNFALIKPWGIFGVATATCVSWLIIAIGTYLLLRTRIRIHVTILDAVRLIILALLFYGCVRGLQMLTHSVSIVNYYVDSLIILAISFAVYLVAGYLLRVYTISELYVLIPEQFRGYVAKLHSDYFSGFK